MTRRTEFLYLKCPLCGDVRENPDAKDAANTVEACMRRLCETCSVSVWRPRKAGPS